ncbi:hypothetical protein BS47DRAFT_1386916 [Hydnum rufescens UP504]|uniref:Nitroreductase domain-containing protein n=1 Tax=Hydnum rufescens UP504 TaxID=1448309 RepID=A0A9P6BB15_9AGAM|nr:hypothetical protein BS47DRAFT_1386916 [Hydnum rufescens UP504]
MSAELTKALASRRTVYKLTDKSSIPDEKIRDIVEQGGKLCSMPPPILRLKRVSPVLHTPTSFNNQAIRAVVLLKEQHIRLWDIVGEVLVERIGAERYQASTKEKIGGFRAAYGTILYFTDTAVIDQWKLAAPPYADRFAQWADHSSGMLQSYVWTALTVEGMGANLQHYNPIIDEKVLAEWNLPKTWVLTAQAPFGIPSPDWVTPEKKFNPIDERVKFFA